MNIIIGDRQSGKTTALIKQSAETGMYILVPTKQQALYLTKQAEQMGIFNMPLPVTVSEVKNGNLRGTVIEKNGLLVDDAEHILNMLLGLKINAMTLTNDENISFL